MMKVNMVGKGTMKLMKPFKTLEEEAEFWGRQDVAERIKDGAIVGVHSAEKTDTLTIRFSHEDIQKLRDEASEQGIGASTLARMLVKKGLQMR